MKQIGRIRTNCFDGFMLGTPYLLMNRNTDSSARFRFLLNLRFLIVKSGNCPEVKRIADKSGARF